MRPIYKILIIIGVVFVIGLIIYFVWNKITDEPQTLIEEGSAGLPLGSEISDSSERGGVKTEKNIVLKKISDQKVFDFWVNEDTGEIYYLNPSGEVFAGKDGPDLKIAEQNLEALNSIEASPGGEKVLAAFGDPQNPQWAIFDVIDKVWRPLPQEITNAAWGENDEKIIALVRSGGATNLVEADLNKTPPVYKTFLRNLILKDVRLISNPPQKILIIERGSASHESRLWQINLKTSAFNLLMSGQNGFQLKFPKGGEVFFSFKSPREFSILDSNFNLYPTEASFDTLPAKCGVSLDFVYCFEPQNLTEKIILPDDYIQKKFYSIDVLWSLNLKNDEQEKIISSNESGVPFIDGHNPQVINNRLYFINRYDNFLYSLQLSNQ